MPLESNEWYGFQDIKDSSLLWYLYLFAQLTNLISICSSRTFYKVSEKAPDNSLFGVELPTLK